jgi:hypothetical protein
MIPDESIHEGSTTYTHILGYVCLVGNTLYIHVPGGTSLTVNRITAIRKTNIHTYSTTEQVVGTWVDGKPIYEITIDCGYFQNTTNVQYFSHGISNLDFVIDLQGFFYDSVASGNLPFVGTASDGISIWVEPTQICIVTQSNRSSYHYYVTLRYTKTTD